MAKTIISAGIRNIAVLLVIGLSFPSDSLAESSLTSNGTYLPAGFCFGVITTGDFILEMALDNDVELFSDTDIEVIKKKAIANAKWEKTYSFWQSDFDNGSSYLFTVWERYVGKPAVEAYSELAGQVTMCIEAIG